MNITSSDYCKLLQMETEISLEIGHKINHAFSQYFLLLYITNAEAKPVKGLSSNFGCKMKCLWSIYRQFHKFMWNK